MRLPRFALLVLLVVATPVQAQPWRLTRIKSEITDAKTVAIVGESECEPGRGPGYLVVRCGDVVKRPEVSLRVPPTLDACEHGGPWEIDVLMRFDAKPAVSSSWEASKDLHRLWTGDDGDEDLINDLQSAAVFRVSVPTVNHPDQIYRFRTSGLRSLMPALIKGCNLPVEK